MTLLMPEERGDFEVTPEGGFLAICYRVIDLGTQKSEYAGEVKFKRKVQFSWELPTEKMQDGRPFSVHKQYNISSSEKSTFRKDLEAWRGKKFTKEDFGKFDIGNVIGVPCYVQVVHTDKGDSTFANVATIMSVPKGVEIPELVNHKVYFSLNKFDENIYNGLSDKLKDTIALSPEYQRIKKGEAAVAASNDSEPPPADESSYGASGHLDAA